MGLFRKNKLVIIILLSVFITILTYYLYSSRKIRVDLTGGKIIVSDGKGPYEDGVDGVQIFSTKIFDLDVFEIQTGRRSAWIDFSNARWVNESMGDIPSGLPSGQYSVDFIIGAVPSRMDIGERQSPIILIYLYSPDARFDIAIPSQHEQNHVDLVRESQERWTLEVDAWFISYDLPIRDVPVSYVRISFSMTMHAFPTYKFPG